jgi:nitrite reductase (NADH) large subunit
MDATVVHVAGSLMNQQLDPPAASLLCAALESRGLRILLNRQTAALLGDGRVQGVRFADGEEIPADLVVMAAGVRPNIELAKAAGLHCDRAIVVDDTLQTYDPRIYAVGECVQHRRSTFGLVAPIWDQARVAAAHLAGAGPPRYVPQAPATQLYSAGDIGGGDDSEDLVLRDRRGGVYKRLVVSGNRLKGAVLYGDVADGPWYFDLIQNGTNIAPFRDHILFGQALCMQAA